MVFDFTQMDHVEDARAQCDKNIDDEIDYMEFTIIPFLENFTTVTKADQSWMLKEIISFTAELNHILKQTHELDINSDTVVVDTVDNEQEEA